MNRRTTLTACTLALSLAVAVCANASEIDAYKDYDAALDAAAESDKPVLIDFYFDT